MPDLIPAAQGLVGIVNAKRLWQENQQFWADKKLPLKQEFIFASTGTKDPSDPPDKYVSALAGSDIQTNPPATNAAIQQMTGKVFTRTVDKLPPADVLADIDQKVDFAKLEAGADGRRPGEIRRPVQGAAGVDCDQAWLMAWPVPLVILASMRPGQRPSWARPAAESPSPGAKIPLDETGNCRHISRVRLFAGGAGMSSIGSGPIGMAPLASSVAATAAQQKSADVNRVQQDGNVQRFQLIALLQSKKPSATSASPMKPTIAMPTARCHGLRGETLGRRRRQTKEGARQDPAAQAGRFVRRTGERSIWTPNTNLRN